MTTGRRMRHLRAVAVAVVAAGALLAAALPASAHDALRSTNPADGATVDRLPERVVLTFDQPALALGSEVVVTGPAGPVTDGPASLVDNEVRQPVRGGPAGRYTVAWRVTSADGHPVSGTFAFTTTQASAAFPPTSSAPATTPPTTAPSATPATATVAARPASESSSGSAVVIVVLLVGLLALLAFGWWAWRRQRTDR